MNAAGLEPAATGGVIAAVDAFALTYPEPHDSGNPRSVTLVRITARDGSCGWGESISRHPEAALAVALIVERGLSPVLVGQRLDIRRLWEQMLDRSSWYGPGIASFAISAVDIALWDLLGQQLDQPVHALLGGSHTDRMRACASVIFDTEDLGATAAEFAGYRDCGYTAVKGGWGRSAATAFGVDPARDVDVVRTIRTAVGPDVDVVIDVGTRVRWSVDHAIRMCRRFEEFDLLWLEEPLPMDRLADYRSLRRASPTALATGEQEWTLAGFRSLILSGGIDIVMPDPGKALGITGVKQVLDLAHAHGLRYTLHSWSSAVNTAAAAHLYAACPAGVVFEVKPGPSPAHDELVSEPMRPVDGWIDVPQRPGLGIDVRPEAVERYEIR